MWFYYCLLTGHWNYTHTIRRPRIRGQVIEVKTQLSHRDYVNLLSQKDETHHPIFKKRRCFIHNNQYFQLDIYCQPCHSRYELYWRAINNCILLWMSIYICCFRCVGLVLLETYSALEDQELLDRLPKFLDIESEVTGNAAYSMFNLSLVEDWDKTKHFCHYLKGNQFFYHWLDKQNIHFYKIRYLVFFLLFILVPIIIFLHNIDIATLDFYF